MQQRTSSLETAVVWATVGLAAFSLPLLSGCAPDASAPDDSATPRARLNPGERDSTAKSRLSHVVEVGNGVYVFPAGADFPETLSDFRGEHPDLRIVSVTQGADVKYGFGDTAWSRANSFVVVTEENAR